MARAARSEIRPDRLQIDLLIAGIPLVVERVLFALFVAQQAVGSALTRSRDVDSLGAQAPLHSQLLVLLADQVDHIAAEQHL